MADVRACRRERLQTIAPCCGLPLHAPPSHCLLPVFASAQAHHSPVVPSVSRRSLFVSLLWSVPLQALAGVGQSCVLPRSGPDRRTAIAVAVVALVHPWVVPSQRQHRRVGRPPPPPPRGDSSIAAASQQQLHRSSSITAAAAYDMSSQQIRFGNLRFLLIVLRRATLLKGSELR
jgi:hypothetical protein